MHSLKFKIFSILLATTIFLISCQIWLIGPMIKAKHIEESIKMQEALASQIANDFDFSFQHAISELEKIARLPGIKSSNKEANDTLIALMDSVTPYYNYFFLMDKTGTWLSYPQRPSLVGKTIPKQNMGWVRETFSKNKTTRLNVINSSKIGKPVAGFSTPVLPESGESEKLLRGVFVLSEENLLLQAIRKIKVGANGWVFLVDEKGWVLTHPHLNQTPENFKTYDFNKYAPVREVLKGKTGHSEYEYNNKTWLACYRPIKSTGWGIIVQQPAVDVFKPIEKDMAIVFRLFLLTLFIYALALFFGIRHNLNPLLELAKTITQRKKIDPNIKYANNEIGELASRFRDMFNVTQESLEAKERSEAALLVYKKSLEEKVIARTRALHDEINDRKKIEIALRSSKEKFQSLTENITDWIWEFDQNSIFTYASPRILDLLGYLPEEVIGTNAFDLMPEGEAKMVHEILRAYVQAHKPFKNLRNVNTHKDGSLVVLESSGTPIFDAGNNFAGYLGVARDITEQDREREELQHSRDLLNTAQQIGHVGSWEWYISSGLLAWSDEIFRIFGRKPQEFNPTFKYFLQTIPPEERKRLQSALHAAFAGKKPYHIEHSIVLPDGSKRVVEEKGQVIRAEDGLPLKMIGSIKDITENKLTEVRLERQVADRTIDLEKAKKEADRANLAKSVFLASMSHELRTPMNSILGFAQLLESDKKDPLSIRQKNHIGTILKSGDHLLKLINDVLDLARIESGNMGEISLEPVNLCSICNETVSLVKTLAESLGIELLPCDELDKSIFIKADRTRFIQIFLNVLTNAIKYNKPGGKVEFGCKKIDKMVRLFISDTGPGIAKGKIGFLFEPFDRLGAEASSIEGSGIGLTISKRLVELMHGSIDVESELGKGSTFFINIPSAENHAENEMFVSQVKEKNFYLKGKHTFLYIEDDHLNRELLIEILGQCTPDIKLLTADCGQDGLEMAIEQKPDLIIMDLTLPDIEGFDAFLWLKKQPGTKNIPVIALSGNAMPSNIKKALDAGFANYLTKPFNITELYRVIGCIFAGTRQ